MTEDNDGPEPQPYGVLPSEQRLSRADAHSVDPADALARLRRLVVYEWPAEGGESGRIGPVAEDFHTRFGVGTGPDDIAAGDPDGAIIAAVQRLAERVDSQNEALLRQREIIDEQRDDIEILRERLESLQTELDGAHRD
jgi:hypothetical protein